MPYVDLPSRDLSVSPPSLPLPLGDDSPPQIETFAVLLKELGADQDHSLDINTTLSTLFTNQLSTHCMIQLRKVGNCWTRNR